MYLVVSSLVFVFPLIYWYYVYFIKNADLRKLRGPRPWPLLGNWIHNDSVGILADLQDLCDKYNPRFLMYTAFQATVFHCDPNHVHKILNSPVRINRSETFDLLKDWLGNGLLTLKGKEWRKRRNMLKQLFGINVMENFVNIFNKVNNTLLEKLEAETDKNFVELMDFTAYSSLDIVLESLAGINLNTQENRNHFYVQMVKDLLQITGTRFFSVFYKFDFFFYIFSPLTGRYLKCLEKVKNFTESIIKAKMLTFNQHTIQKDNGKVSGTMKKFNLVEVLLNEFENNNIDYQGVEDEIKTFMAAGHETSSGSLAFILFVLSRHPEEQMKVYEEIMSINPTGDFSVQHLNQMNYLETVIKETLRLYTIIPFLERKISEPLELDGIKYPARTNLAIPVISLHMNAEYFPQPNKFIPDRFSAENIDKIPRGAFIPFGGGPKMCIGYKFAMNSAKCAVAKCVRNLELLPVPGFQLQLSFQISLKSLTGIPCRLKKRILVS